jgi:hypothetical protein
MPTIDDVNITPSTSTKQNDLGTSVGNSNVPTTAGGTEAQSTSEVDRSDIRSYMVLAQDPSEADDLEKFLRAKVHPGNHEKINQITRRSKVVG